MKVCKRCKIEKAVSEYYKAGKYLHSECKACTKELATEWSAKNPEKVAERKRAYFHRNKERVMKVRREYLDKNAERIKKYRAEFHAANPHKARQYNAKRKAALLQATPKWADADKIKEFYFAADFLGMVTGEWYHVDHTVPLNNPLVCGLHVEQNLQVLPASDNLRKSNRHWPDMP